MLWVFFKWKMKKTTTIQALLQRMIIAVHENLENKILVKIL